MLVKDPHFASLDMVLAKHYNTFIKLVSNSDFFYLKHILLTSYLDAVDLCIIIWVEPFCLHCVNKSSHTTHGLLASNISIGHWTFFLLLSIQYSRGVEVRPLNFGNWRFRHEDDSIASMSYQYIYSPCLFKTWTKTTTTTTTTELAHAMMTKPTEV